MDELIEALTILKKYLKPQHQARPTFCGHDCLVVKVEEKELSVDDMVRLEQLGFAWEPDYQGWGSFRYGE